MIYINKFFSMIKDIFKGLDKTALHILKRGLHFCIVLCIISIIILFIFQFFITNFLMFELGFTILRASIIFAIEFVICAIAADKIKKQII